MSDELPDYRPVSPLAVAALAAGFGSSLVLFTQLAAMLPLVAIALAVTALAGIHRSEGRMVGRWPALGGLALAVGFASQALATTVADGMVARQRALATAMNWVTAVREDRMDDAIAVSSPGALASMSQSRPEADSDSEVRREVFRVLPEVQAVAGCQETPPGAPSAERTTDGWVVRVSLDGCGHADDLLLFVAPRFVSLRGQAVEEWLVNAFTLER